MSLSNVPAGKELPDDFNVIIEIPAHSDPVKYEVDKDSGALVVDRFMATPMFYPCNYGYIPNTLSEDGDPIDVLVPTPHAIQCGSVIRCRPIAVLDMEDESGRDYKVLAVPHSKLTTHYDNVQEASDLPELLLQQIQHFFENYKDLEKGKWVKVVGWQDREAAREAIAKSAEAAAKA
jgi:inorganic pyrophosphatase